MFGTRKHVWPALWATVAIVCAPAMAAAAAATPLVALQKACDKGDHKSCVTLGIRYAKGDAAPKNGARAAELFASACEADVVSGCINLGVLNATGDGVRKDVGRAAELFGQGCDKGEARGCRLRGQLLYHGDGVEKDLATAAGLFSMACDLGDMAACRAAAIQHAFGQGVKVDAAKANALFRMACDGGVTEACDSLRRRRKALLWRVDGAKPSFLVPLVSQGLAIWDLPEKTRQTLDACEHLVTLADYADVDRKQLERGLQLKSGSSLSELVAKEVMEGLEAELGVSTSKIASVHPAALIEVIELARDPAAYALLGQLGQRALRKGRKPTYLTTPSEIARRVSDADVKAFAALLTELMLHRDRQRKHQQDMADAFRQGDEAALERQVFSPHFMQVAGALVEPLIRAPEKAWADAIAPLLKQGGVCVALDAAHFLGKNNLRDKLTKSGFSISRVGNQLPAQGTP